MKCAYTAESLIDGQMVMDLLTVAGVPCLMFNENAVGGFGELPVTYPEVWVKRDRDLPKALRMIDEFENSSSPAADIPCDTCGEYNPDTFELCWRCNTTLVEPPLRRKYRMRRR